MMYNELAKYYDALVKDEEATNSWVSFIDSHSSGKELMEIACGSGEITIALANKGYHIDASDLSEQMIAEAKKKAGAEHVSFSVMDMREWNAAKTYDGILCLCDSINYLTKKEEVEALVKNVYNTLKEDGVFLFDMHSMDRLVEFEEEFLEDGIANGHEYTWSIVRMDDCLHHNFIFYEGDYYVQEQHIQKVYSPMEMEAMLAPYFEVEVYTDFTIPGITEGEKYFYVCRRK